MRTLKKLRVCNTTTKWGIHDILGNLEDYLLCMYAVY